MSEDYEGEEIRRLLEKKKKKREEEKAYLSFARRVRPVLLEGKARLWKRQEPRTGWKTGRHYSS